MIDSNQNLMTFYDYPSVVKASIYTTNLIEGLNKQIKRKFKLKEQFPTELSIEKYLVAQFNKYNEQAMNRSHKGFGQIIISQWFND